MYKYTVDFLVWHVKSWGRWHWLVCFYGNMAVADTKGPKWHYWSISSISVGNEKNGNREAPKNSSLTWYKWNDKESRTCGGATTQEGGRRLVCVFDEPLHRFAKMYYNRRLLVTWNDFSRRDKNCMNFSLACRPLFRLLREKVSSIANVSSINLCQCARINSKRIWTNCEFVE